MTLITNLDMIKEKNPSGLGEPHARHPICPSIRRWGCVWLIQEKLRKAKIPKNK